MTPDAIAVITYPGHCVTTALTIKNLLSLTDWQVPFYLFVDDLGDQYKDWNGDYIQDIKGFYQQEFEVVLFSDFQFGHIWDGWLRQQMVKLNLDRFLPGDTWYVTDGDVYLKEVLRPSVTPFNFVPRRNKMIHAQNRSYLKHILQTDNIILEKEQRYIFTHHAPFRWVKKIELELLRQTVSRMHHNDFNLIHLHLMREERIIGFGPDEDSLSMTEWDLLEVFKQKVLHIDLDLEYWPLRTDADIENQAKFWTFFGTDKDIDPQWFEKFDVYIPQNIQEKILTISRT